MELKEFVETAILDLIRAVGDAADQATSLGGEVNPGHMSLASRPDGMAYTRDTRKSVQMVSFEISVRTSATRGLRGALGIVVAGAEAGIRSTWGRSRRESARLSFSVPVVFPSSPEIKESE